MRGTDYICQQVCLHVCECACVVGMDWRVGEVEFAASEWARITDLD